MLTNIIEQWIKDVPKSPTLTHIITRLRRLYLHYQCKNADTSRITIDLASVIEDLEKLDTIRGQRDKREIK